MSGSKPICTEFRDVGITGDGQVIRQPLEIYDPSGIENSSIFNGSIQGGDQGMRIPQETHKPSGMPTPDAPKGRG